MRVRDEICSPGNEYSGQNLRSYPVVMQWVEQKIEIVWPALLKTTDPKLPAPPEWPLAMK